jgi:hypothetical protein
MASQPHGPDVNGPVYWRAKLDEGNNPQSAPQLSVTQVLHFLNWNLVMLEFSIGYFQGDGAKL